MVELEIKSGEGVEGRVNLELLEEEERNRRGRGGKAEGRKREKGGGVERGRPTGMFSEVVGMGRMGAYG